MKKIFVINPGYDLERSVSEWKQGKFPGHILYGVNEFEEYGFTPLFPQKTIGYNNGGFNRIRLELNVINELLKRKKEYDMVYIPYLNLGMSACALKRLQLIHKPIIALVHGIDFRKKALYTMYFNALSRIIIISEPLYNKFCESFPNFVFKAEYIPLMPEILDATEQAGYRYDIASIGKTYRDYDVLVQAIKGTKYRTLIVGTKELEEVEEPNLEVVTNFVDYGACLQYYREARVNIVTMQEKDGIFGLTSVLDTFTVCRPIIVTKTKFLSVPVEEWGLGIEVEAGNVEQLRSAIDKMSNDTVFYNNCVQNIKRISERYNMHIFNEKICRIFKKEMI